MFVKVELQDGIDKMLGRHRLAILEIEHLNLTVEFAVYPDLGFFRLLCLRSLCSF